MDFNFFVTSAFRRLSAFVPVKTQVVLNKNPITMKNNRNNRDTNTGSQSGRRSTTSRSSRYEDDYRSGDNSTRGNAGRYGRNDDNSSGRYGSGYERNEGNNYSEGGRGTTGQ